MCPFPPEDIDDALQIVRINGIKPSAALFIDIDIQGKQRFVGCLPYSPLRMENSLYSLHTN